MDFKNCCEVSMDNIYNAFKIGFSDYIIKFDFTKEVFVKRFFGPEGNSLEHSFIAFDDAAPVGLILGGIKVYEGVKTLRCGTLCIHPDYRGKGVSQELFRLHKQIALDNNCKQLFLEVIVGNDRAVNFYKRLGYEKIYDIVYYSSKDMSKIRENNNNSIQISEVDFNKLVQINSGLKDTHINWQNDLDFIEKMENQIHFGAYQNTDLVGAVSINKSGKISFLWVNPELRHSGIASKLIAYSRKELELQNIVVSFPNNANLEGFFKKLGFKKDVISLFEMYLTL